MSFIFLILEWYAVHQRPFPWRTEGNVYRVWLSEIILQQTRVNQGMQYYLDFLQKYPTVFDLAAAEEQEVLKLWQGLGYYSRARNLHKTAKILVMEFKGNFPSEFAELKKLPGIGPYTAAAIASICFEEKVPAIDGNAYRVYSRVYGLDKDISDANALKYFFDFAKEKMPEDSPGDFNEAIMELGATVCLPKNPGCYECPVNQHCVAFQTGKIDLFPVKSRKVKIRSRYFHFFFIQNKKNGEFLIQKRTEKDVWHGLFQFPLTESRTAKLPESSFTNDKPVVHSSLKHILTHQHLYIQFYKIKLNDSEFNTIKKTQSLTAISKSQITNYPFPKPIFEFLNTYFKD